jgi:MurNAc alpha-1-phosphate uridylyltransferase
MLLAAGRGERMRPLTDARPKPLLEAGGKALIEWQIERLARAGFTEIVINHAHLGGMLVARLGDGSRHGVRIRWSPEPEPLETAGGIVQALPLLEPEGRPEVVLVASADVYCDYDFARLRGHEARLLAGPARLHLVMVPNPPYHPGGDFALVDGTLRAEGGPKLTFGNIGLYRTDLFRPLPRGEKLRLTPYYAEWIGRGWATGELYAGRWHNVGTADDLARLDAELRGEAALPGRHTAPPTTTNPREHE